MCPVLCTSRAALTSTSSLVPSTRPTIPVAAQRAPKVGSSCQRLLQPRLDDDSSRAINKHLLPYASFVQVADNLPIYLEPRTTTICSRCPSSSLSSHRILSILIW